MNAYPYTVLFVDDDEMSRAMLQALLNGRFEKIISASTAAEAIQCFQNESIDFVICDLHMDNMDGIELLTNLQMIDPHVIAIAISSDSSEETLIRTMRAGFHDFIKKPISPDDFSKQMIMAINAIQSERRYRHQRYQHEQYLKIANATVLSCKTDLKGVITEVNDNYCKAFGYSAEELVGNTHKILRHPKTPPKVYAKVWETLLAGKTYRGTFINLTKKKKTCAISLIITPWYDEYETKTGYFSMGYDVTQLYESQQHAKEQATVLRTIINEFPDMIAVTNGKRLILANSSILNFTGFDSLESFHKKYSSLYELVKEKNAEITCEKWLDAALETIQNGGIVRIKIENAATKQLHTFKLFIHKLGNSHNYVVLFHDETAIEAERQTLISEVNNATWELMEAQSNFQMQYERFEHAINSSRDGFWDLDLRTHEFYLSPGWKKRLGFAEDETVTYTDYAQLIDEINVPSRIQSIINMTRGMNEAINTSANIQYKLKTKNNESIIIDDFGNILYNEDQKPYRIVGFHRDVTDQVEQNEILNAQNRMASMGEMVSNIAHQWRQPIAAINNVVNDLEFEIELDDIECVPSKKIFEVTKEIKQYSDFLSKTINDFRDFVKIDRKKENFYLVEAIDNAIGIISHTYRQFGIKLEVQYPESDDIIIYGAPRELAQVLLNILNNAKDALSEKQTKNPFVKIEVTKKENACTIFISDNAGGIPDDVMPRIFDPYFTTKHESIGTGIGLSMSKNIIDTHFKGLLKAKNTSIGAVFSIDIPIVSP